MKAITYQYGFSKGVLTATIRGQSIKESAAKDYIKANGFRYIFQEGRRKVCGWRASMGVHKLIEVLIHLNGLGYDIKPSSTLPSKKWLYLEAPKVIYTISLKGGQKTSQEDLIVWLEGEGYRRLPELEDPGDFAIKGEQVLIWTREDDKLVRIVLDGETIETIAYINAETLDNDFVPEVTIKGLVERVDDAAPTTGTVVPELSSILTDIKVRQPKAIHQPYRFVKPRYSKPHRQNMYRSLVKLDEKHPFFNMIKWD